MGAPRSTARAGAGGPSALRWAVLWVRLCGVAPLLAAALPFVVLGALMRGQSMAVLVTVELVARGCVSTHRGDRAKN